jgi:hypothetical protein
MKLLMKWFRAYLACVRRPLTEDEEADRQAYSF